MIVGLLSGRFGSPFKRKATAVIVEEIKRQQDTSYNDFKRLIRSNPELAKSNARERLVEAKIIKPNGTLSPHYVS